jgi:hypothetical protein
LTHGFFEVLPEVEAIFSNQNVSREICSLRLGGGGVEQKNAKLKGATKVPNLICFYQYSCKCKSANLKENVGKSMN